MVYIVNYDGLSFPVNDVSVNRTPPFSFFWGIKSQDLVGIIRDDTKDHFQITFSTQNIKMLVEKLLQNFKNGNLCSIVTPYASFSDAMVHNVTIDNDQLNVSLIATNPGQGQLETSNICLATAVNYQNTCPGFVNFYQFGNYLAISTFPFTLNRSVTGGSRIFNNNVWSIFRLPVLRQYSVLQCNIDSLECYCYTNLPELMTPVIIQPSHGKQYSYIFGIHTSCELAAYLCVEDLSMGEIWFKVGNRGVLDLAPGSYRLTPVVVIPESQPQFIHGESTVLNIPNTQTILSFLTPLTLPHNEKLKLYASENLILQFDGWKTITLVPDTLTEIDFDYAGTFQCNVFSVDRNIPITSFTVNVYGTGIQQDIFDYAINVNNDIVTTWSSVSMDGSGTFIAFDENGRIVGRNNQTLFNVSDQLLTHGSHTIVDADTQYTVTDNMGNILDSTMDIYVKSVDVFFHGTPVVGKPVLMSVDGLVSNVTVTDAEVDQISNVTYKLTFNSDGLKRILLNLPDGTVLDKYVSVMPGFKKIIQVTDNQVTCTTGDYWAIIQSPTLTYMVPPNSSYSWTEYSFGLTDINVILAKGSRTTNVQYRYLIYNKDALKVVSRGRTLQLLAPPNAEIDHVAWYIDNTLIGIGNTLHVPLHISGDTYNIKTVVYSNSYQTVLTESINIPHSDTNRIQLSCQIIHPHINPDSTNRLVTIYNEVPQVNYKYLDSSLNIRLSKYMYMEKYTYVGNVNDLTW